MRNRIRRRIGFGGVAAGMGLVCGAPPALADEPTPYAWAETSGVTPYAALSIRSLCTFDDGSGPAIYAGGRFFSFAPEAEVVGVMRWTGEGWQPVGQPISVRALAVFTDPVLGTGLYAASSDVQRWNGSAWEALPEALTSAPNFGSIYTLFVHDFGQGPRLLAGGQFRGVSTQADGAAMWDGTHWSRIGPPAPPTNLSTVYAFEVFDEGAGPTLFAAGHIRLDPNNPLAYASVVRVEGNGWSQVLVPQPPVFALKTFDDGSGQALYAGCRATSLLTTPMVRKWDGVSWTNLPPFPHAGFCTPTANGSGVLAVQVFDEGDGPALYAAGGLLQTCDQCEFPVAAGVSRYRNGVWEPLGSGLTYPPFLAFSGEPHPSATSTSSATTLALFERDGVRSLIVGCGEQPTQLVDRGNSSAAGGRRSRNFGMWSPALAPPQPVSPVLVSARTGDLAEIRVPIEGGVLSMHWLRNGQPLHEGSNCAPPPPYGGKYAGVRSDSLFVRCVRPSDAGTYELVIEYQGGSVTATVLLEVEGCAEDLTFDGRVDMQDLNAVLSRYGRPTNPNFCSAEAVYDGVIDFLDLNAVLSAFGTACE